jgi:hypothetical protein
MIEATIDLSTLFKATILVHEGYGINDGEKKLKPRLVDADRFLYAEARYESNDERDELIERCGDVSTLYLQTGSDSEESFRTVETPEEIDALIVKSQDKRMKRIQKSRLGIGII